MKSLTSKLIQHKTLLGVISLGIILRLLFAFLFNHVFDFFNILVLVKSVADTNSLLEGFYVLKNQQSLEVQLYGKIYYQVAALWLHFLEYIKLLDIGFLFDTAKYDPKNANYLSGLGKWGPEIYQLTAIKLVQLIYDFILVFFLLKITAFLKPGDKKSLITIALFWALNPVLMYGAYVPFQSDLAMVAFLVGGLYFAAKAFGQEKHRFISKDVILMLLFWAVGAVIKQVPLLFVVPLLIILSGSVLSFILYLVSFGFCYFLISQPWSNDSTLIKTFFLTSEESTALFNFQLNGVSVFMFLYFSLLLGVILFRNKFKESYSSILKLCLLIILVIYIGEDQRYFFSQFSTWAVPFIGLLALTNPTYIIFLLLPLAGFYKWAVIDSSALTGSMFVTLGNPLHYVPSFDSIAQKFINPKILHISFTSFFIFLCVCLTVYLVVSLWKKDNLNLKFNLNTFIIGFFALYIGILVTDYTIKSQSIALTNTGATNSLNAKLDTAAYIVYITNPQKRKITGITLEIYRKDIDKSDNVILKFTDDNTDKVLFIQKVNDYRFPEFEDDVDIFLKKPITNIRTKLEIYKEYGHNNLFIKTSDKLIDVDPTYKNYDTFYKNQNISLSFPGQVFAINLKGSYTVQDIFKHVAYHISIKPFFYIGYGLVILILTSLSLYSLLLKRYKA